MRFHDQNHAVVHAKDFGPAASLAMSNTVNAPISRLEISGKSVQEPVGASLTLQRDTDTGYWLVRGKTAQVGAPSPDAPAPFVNTYPPSTYIVEIDGIEVQITLSDALRSLGAETDTLWVDPATMTAWVDKRVNLIDAADPAHGRGSVGVSGERYSAYVRPNPAAKGSGLCNLLPTKPSLGATTESCIVFGGGLAYMSVEQKYLGTADYASWGRWVDAQHPQILYLLADAARVEVPVAPVALGPSMPQPIASCTDFNILSNGRPTKVPHILRGIPDGDGGWTAQDKLVIGESDTTVERRVGRIEAQETRWIYNTADALTAVFYCNVPDYTPNSRAGLCTHFPQATTLDRTRESITYATSINIVVTRSTIGAAASDTGAPLTAKFNDWLTARRAAGDPVIIQYLLAEAVTDPVPRLTVRTEQYGTTLATDSALQPDLFARAPILGR